MLCYQNKSHWDFVKVLRRGDLPCEGVMFREGEKEMKIADCLHLKFAVTKEAFKKLIQNIYEIGLCGGSDRIQMISFLYALLHKRNLKIELDTEFKRKHHCEDMSLYDVMERSYHDDEFRHDFKEMTANEDNNGLT
jgi:hypothetical protein